MGLSGGESSFMISSTVWIQYTNVTDGRTDGWRDTGQLHRPHLCTVLHNNKRYI